MADFSPYHAGEVFVQQRVGVQSIADNVSVHIRNFINDQHKAFFQELSLLHIAVRNSNGQVWATVLCGYPGFIEAADKLHLRITAKQFCGDPVQLSKGHPFGAVGVMLHNRRRNKMTGFVESSTHEGVVVKVSQAIGNCPKYIQIRHLQFVDTELQNLGKAERNVKRGGPALGEEEKAFVKRSDTMFLASCFGSEDHAGSIHGCDCNHRGGAPGFVQVIDDKTLLIPDYIGNNMFQSLGNIVTNPAAGIQFLDFTNGNSLQLTGHAEIIFDDTLLPGAQRSIKFSVGQWVHVTGALPITTSGPVEPSPYNPILANSSSDKVFLKCTHRQLETPDIMTFQFNVPASTSRKPFCQAGQFASFDFEFEKGKTLNRTWTISSPPQEVADTGKFTISVKKAGLVSGYLHEKMVVGERIQFRGVDGDFTLDKAAKCIPPAGVLLIAGGIGVTPMRVMFAECLKRGYPVVFLYSFRTCDDGAFLEEFQKGADSKGNAKLAVVLTGASCSQVLTGMEVFHGRLDANIIKQVCPDCKQREVFQCGPNPMMSSAIKSLQSLGLSTTQIHQEAFNF